MPTPPENVTRLTCINCKTFYRAMLCISGTSFGLGKGGNVTSAGWQVTLCDPMWHVSSRSGVATLRTAIHLLLAMGLCPSVCLSQVGVLLKRLNVGSHETTPRDSPGTLVFCHQRSLRNSTGISPAGAPSAGGVSQNRRLSTNSWPYLENSTR